MSGAIGVDFDNTIAGYDQLIHKIAVSKGLIDPLTVVNKKIVRDTIRNARDGERQWRQVQGIVYGPRMGEADLIEGARDFFTYCRSEGLETFIVSHKTEFADFDETGTNLRRAAMSWMEKQGFFGGGLGMTKDRVFFESTREKKIERIAKLECSHFIDDLEEVFLEKTFPVNVKKILMASSGGGNSSGAIRFSSWSEIIESFSAGAV